MRFVPEMPHGHSVGSAVRAHGLLVVLATGAADKACMPALRCACPAATAQTEIFCMIFIIECVNDLRLMMHNVNEACSLKLDDKIKVDVPENAGHYHRTESLQMSSSHNWHTSYRMYDRKVDVPWTWYLSACI